MDDITIIGPGSVSIGRKASIGKNVRAIFSKPARLVLDDYVTIGDNTKFIIESGDVTIGDWSTLHNDMTVLSKRGVSIGAHCWFGQYTVIDGTGGITIENGVRVGMYSQLWTHVAAGEQIEGCTLLAEVPSHIGEDVWLVGTCFVSSGITIGRRTIALSGANITKSCPEYSVLAGAPARIREGASFYRDISLDEKMSLLEGWLKDFCAANAIAEAGLAAGDDFVALDAGQDGRIVFHKTSASFAAAAEDERTTHCDVEAKKYGKKFTEIERKALKFLSGNKARFYAV